MFERAGARAFALATRGATKLQMLRAVMIAWPAVEDEIASRPAPFMFSIDRTGALHRNISPPTGRTT